MKHPHQFLIIDKDNRAIYENERKIQEIKGVKVVCVECGEQRSVWVDGKIKVWETK